MDLIDSRPLNRVACAVQELPHLLADTDAARHWAATTGGRRIKGVCVPLFSLRSDRGCGIGDVGDLPGAIDYCARSGMELLQLLPINDSGLDGVPYSAMSAFAIDPAFIAIDDIPGLDETFLMHVSSVTAPFREAGRIDNPRVRRLKIDLLRQAWNLVRNDALISSLDAFCVDNPWVVGYAAFKVVKDIEGLRPWEEWASVAGLSTDQVIKLARATPDFNFHVFCQYTADRQFAAAHRYARSRGVLLEGDIPILVARDSADVWAERWMFHLDFAAGAPPDMYAEDGQHWGFPTYNWDAIERDDYRWWRQRLRTAQRYFDCYRIDHIVGFFRIWTIDVHAPNGRQGWFDPSDEAVWGDHGRKILGMMLDSTDMLPLGEDLGTIPHICRSTMLDMGICGLKVQRWEKRWEGDRKFIAPADYLPVSVATLSTHDCELAPEWWRNADAADRQELWELLGGQGPAPTEMSPELATTYLRWFDGCGSLFTVHALGDLLYAAGRLPGDPADHRINVPGQVGPRNWSWRCPVSLE